MGLGYIQYIARIESVVSVRGIYAGEEGRDLELTYRERLEMADKWQLCCV